MQKDKRIQQTKASDAVCIWLLIGQSQSVIAVVKKK